MQSHAAAAAAAAAVQTCAMGEYVEELDELRLDRGPLWEAKGIIEPPPRLLLLVLYHQFKKYFFVVFCFSLFFFVAMEEEKTVDMLSIDTFNDAIDGCLLLSSGVGIDCDILRPAQIPRGDKDGKCNLLQCCVVVPASDCPHSSIPVDDSFFFCPEASLMV